MILLLVKLVMMTVISIQQTIFTVYIKGDRVNLDKELMQVVGAAHLQQKVIEIFEMVIAQV